MNTLRRITRHAAKALAAGTVVAAAALPLIGATAAQAFSANGSYLTLTQNASSVPANPGSSSSAPVFGAGWSGSGTVNLTSADQSTLNGSGTASFTVTTTANAAATGITFTGGAETTATVAATISSSATAAAGWYNLTVTDSGGSISIPNAFYVDAAPTITSVSPTALTNGATNVAATVTGTGFIAGTTATLTDPSTNVSIGTLNYASPTTLTGFLSASSAGTYLVNVSSPDGGAASSSTVGVTVTGPSITSFSPTAIAYSSTAPTTTVTVNGTGFAAGAYVTVTGLPGTASYSSGTFVSATQMTFTITLADTSTGSASIVVHNVDNSTASYANAIGINQNSTSVTPTITAVTPAMTLPVPGSGQLNITGTGFGLPGSSDTVHFQDNAGLADGGLTCGTVNVISDTQLTCVAATANGVMSGAHSVTVTSGKTSAAFANAITVAGPTISAVSPSTVSAGYQGDFTVTGTGFPTSATNSVVTGGNQTAAAEAVTLNAGPSSSGGTYKGDTVAGTGVTSGTTVTANTTTSATLSKPTTAWLSATPLTFTYNVASATIVLGSSTVADKITFAGTSTDGVVVGMAVTDNTTANNIAASTTVASVAYATNVVTVTLSSMGTAVAASADSITFTDATNTGTQTASAAVIVGSTTGIVSGATVTGTNVGASSTNTVFTVTASTSTVTLTASTSAPIVAGTPLTFSSTPTATVYGYDAAGNILNGGTGVTGSVTYSTTTSLTVTVPSTSAIQSVGGMYVIVLALPTGNVDVAVSELGTLTITGISYSSSTVTGVGQGATGQTVYIAGTGFLPGATVTFGSTSGITATVTSVTPTLITASVSVSSATPVTTSAVKYPFTVTNTVGTTLNSANASTPVYLTVDAAPTVSSAVPASVVAGAAATTITLTGTGFVSGATVTSSSSLLTITAVTYVSPTSLTFSASGPAINGTVNVGLALTVTNPDGGLATTSFSINPQPTVTGVYYVPTFSTNYEIDVTGTGFSPGPNSTMTVTSSNTDYSVQLAQVNTAGTVATLLVTTTSSATSGTSSNVTFTNPDGSTVTFKLNGGPAPTPTPAKTFTLKRVVGVAVAGRTRIMRIYGTGFYGRPTVRSNAGGTRAIVIHDNGKMLTLRVTVRANVRKGTHVFTIILKNGQRNHINYLQR